MQQSFFSRFLNGVESAGNKLPSAFLIFIILAVGTIIVSAIAASSGVSAEYQLVEGGKLISKTVAAKSLLTAEGILFMLGSVISNFTGFFPLGTVFFTMLGIGLAERAGLMHALLYYVAAWTPKRLLTATVVFLGVMSNAAAAAGYMVLVPLGALIFLAFKRHPIAGLAAAFAGVSGGWSANLLLASNDAVFAGIATAAAHLLDGEYTVLPTANWYFMATSTFLITAIGTFVTDKIVEPRLGAYKGAQESFDKLTLNETRAMKLGILSGLIYVLAIILLALPEASILRHPETHLFTGGALMKNLIVFIGVGFFIPGLVFGLAAGKIKSSHDIAFMMEETIGKIAGFLVLIFFAAQFIAYFNHSNMGIIIAIKGADLLKNIGFTGLPLIISLVVFTALLNLLIAVDTAKWALMAPIFVPMLMLLGISPELTLAAYRVGDSVTNIIAPTMPLFPLIVAFSQKYDPKLGIGSLVSIMLPYSIAFLIFWIILLGIWFFAGFDLGPNAPLFYTKTF